ncbi:MAG: hypothetical protein WAR77_14755 [Saprospiraceae bacterium]
MKNRLLIKLLYAPYNIASMPAVTMDYLNQRDDILAKGVSIEDHHFTNYGKDKKKYWKTFNVYTNLSKPISFIGNLLQAEYYLIKRILWADIIIWQWDTKVYLPHYFLIWILKKPILIEWVGSDIRIPEIVIANSPFYKSELENGNYTYTKESYKRSLSIQRKFKFLNAIPLVAPEMSLFLDRSLFPEFYLMYQRIRVEDYQVKYPDLNCKIPVIVHAPSATGGKGTRFVRIAIENLKLKYDFKYIEIINKTHEEAILAIAGADIFLDQFLVGSYGAACCEAMAMGKPAFCYLIEPVIELLPKECPIVNANPDTLESILKEYLMDSNLRYQTGVRSRTYVENYHEAGRVTTKLVALIKKILY